ncbi:disulfide bond formation protein B [Pseudomonas sp.]|jgi:protein dithiol:quinone oxidoreductase|uniref:disulfide bond formation protein B n=1 Tax=Pseudomonas sp. TaxID=306 RepID=UPI00272BBA3A|nr:disulfide bond formation protein B [Pseudomonas sp.]
MTLPASRPLYFIAFIVCALLLLTALYMEHVMGLMPCPLCLIQRGAFIVIALVCLIAMFHNPQPAEGRQRSIAARVYPALLALFAAFGAAIAGRQVWLQHLPSDQLPSCLPSLDYMMDVLPLREVLGLLFSGTADCAAVTWTFLGLSIAEGTLIAFICFTLFAAVQLFRRDD